MSLRPASRRPATIEPPDLPNGANASELTGMNVTKLIKRFRIEKAGGFKLSEFDPADTCGLDIGKSAAKDMIADGLKALTELQKKLYAQDRWALLVVLQRMDAAGKDAVV